MRLSMVWLRLKEFQMKQYRKKKIKLQKVNDLSFDFTNVICILL